jgi:hypothetical protein
VNVTEEDALKSLLADIQRVLPSVKTSGNSFGDSDSLTFAPRGETIVVSSGLQLALATLMFVLALRAHLFILLIGSCLLRIWNLWEGANP